jgi:hypothetical protein
MESVVDDGQLTGVHDLPLPMNPFLHVHWRS